MSAMVRRKKLAKETFLAIKGKALENPACRDEPLELFFSSELRDTRAAKNICEGCVERRACFEIALKDKERVGVWGGVSFRRGAPDPADIGKWRSSASSPDDLPDSISEGTVRVTSRAERTPQSGTRNTYKGPIYESKRGKAQHKNAGKRTANPSGERVT